jgi:hypothetical protein
VDIEMSPESSSTAPIRHEKRTERGILLENLPSVLFMVAIFTSADRETGVFWKKAILIRYLYAAFALFSGT